MASTGATLVSKVLLDRALKMACSPIVGKDPATDLRGGGMFGLAQLLDFTQDIKNKELVDSLFKMSLDPVTVSGYSGGGPCSRICL